MNIEQAVKQAIEEFGKEAYKRFNVLSVDSDCPHAYMANALDYNDVVRNLSYKNHVKIKPMPELFEHDVSFYGADAYLMWEWVCTDEINAILAQSNKELDFKKKGLIIDGDVKRKNSAALPFDLPRAIAGDVVECLYHRTHQVLPCTLTDKLGDVKNGIAVCCDGELFIAQERELRMKFPKKAAK